MRGQVRLQERALRHDVAAERAHASLGLGVGERQDGARAAERAAERQQRGRARVDRPVVLVELVQKPLGVARRVLDPGDGHVAQQAHGDPGRCDLGIVVRAGRAYRRRPSRPRRNTHVGRARPEATTRAGRRRRGPRRRGCSAAAWRAEGAPVPAITGMDRGTARRTASSRAIRSAGSRAAASPVVPATTTARTPRSTSCAASAALADASRSPRSSNSVTSATPTPVKTGAATTASYRAAALPNTRPKWWPVIERPHRR